MTTDQVPAEVKRPDSFYPSNAFAEQRSASQKKLEEQIENLEKRPKEDSALRTAIERLELQLNDLKNASARDTEKFDIKFQEEKNKLQAEKEKVQTMHTNLEALTKESKELREMNSAQARRIEDFEYEKAVFESDLQEKSNAERAEFEKQLLAFQTRETQRLKSQIVDLERQKGNLEKRLKARQDLELEAGNDQGKLKAYIDQLTAEVERVKSENGELVRKNEAFVELDSALAAATTECKELENRLAELSRTNTANKKTIKSLDDDLDKMTKEKELVEVQLEEKIEEQRKSEDEKILALNHQIWQLQNDEKGLRIRLEAKESELSKLKESSKLSLEGRAKKIDQLEENLQTLKMNEDRLRKEWDDAIYALSSNQTKVMELEKEIKRLEKDLEKHENHDAQVRTTNLQLQSEMESLQSEYEKEKKQHMLAKCREEQLKTELEGVKGELQLLLDTVAEFNACSVDTQKKLDNIVQERDLLIIEVEELKSKLGKARKEADIIKQPSDKLLISPPNTDLNQETDNNDFGIANPTQEFPFSAGFFDDDSNAVLGSDHDHTDLPEIQAILDSIDVGPSTTTNKNATDLFSESDEVRLVSVQVPKTPTKSAEAPMNPPKPEKNVKRKRSTRTSAPVSDEPAVKRIVKQPEPKRRLLSSSDPLSQLSDYPEMGSSPPKAMHAHRVVRSYAARNQTAKSPEIQKTAEPSEAQRQQTRIENQLDNVYQQGAMGFAGTAQKPMTAPPPPPAPSKRTRTNANAVGLTTKTKGMKKGGKK